MHAQNIEFGKAAETAAAEYLKTQGCKILERNYKNKFGEIDIIVLANGVTCFVEVKARHSSAHGLPQEAVTLAKQRQISKVAVGYLKSKRIFDRPARFDVLALLYEDDQPQITWIKNAFELSANFTV